MECEAHDGTIVGLGRAVELAELAPQLKPFLHALDCARSSARFIGSAVAHDRLAPVRATTHIGGRITISSPRARKV